MPIQNGISFSCTIEPNKNWANQLDLLLEWLHLYRSDSVQSSSLCTYCFSYSASQRLQFTSWLCTDEHAGRKLTVWLSIAKMCVWRGVLTPQCPQHPQNTQHHIMHMPTCTQSDLNECTRIIHKKKKRHCSVSDRIRFYSWWWLTRGESVGLSLLIKQ